MKILEQILTKTAQPASTGKKQASASTSDPFQSILQAAVKNQKPSTAEGTAKPDETTPDTRPEQPQADDATLAAAAAQAATIVPQEQQPAQPEAETADTTEETLAVTAQNTAPNLPQVPAAAQPDRMATTTMPQTADTAPTQPTAGETAGKTSLFAAESLQTETTPAPQAEVSRATSPPIQTQQAPDNRLTTLLEQKQQELAGRGTTAAQPQQTADTQQTTNATQTDSTVAESTDNGAQASASAKDTTGTQPAEPAATETAEKAQPATAQSQATTASASTARLTEQQPLQQMPETDRAVLQMRENTEPTPTPVKPTQQASETLAETATAAQAQTPRVEPQPVQQPVETREPERPAVQTDQMEQVRLQATKQLEEGRMEFRMQLQPEELGKVSVKMVLEGGRLAIEILAATPKAAELLARQAEGLAQSLRLQQTDVQSIQIVTESQAASEQMDGAFQMLNGGARQGGQQAGAQPQFGGRHAAGTETADGEPTPTHAQDAHRAPETLLDYAV